MKTLITIICTLLSVAAFAQKEKAFTISTMSSVSIKATVDLSQKESERKVDMFTIKLPKHSQFETAQEVERGGVNGDLFKNPLKTKKLTAPEIEGGFSSGFLNYMPNDDDVAISNDGILVSMTNGWTVIMDDEGNEIKRLDDNELFAIQDPADPDSFVNVFDPHVTYDPVRDRWFAVIDQVQYKRTGNTATYNVSTGKISLAFSKTNDPNGEWSIYEIPTYYNIHNLGVALDYPEIAFTNSEIIITGNLTDFNSGLGTRHTVVYQVPFAKGYAGEEFDYATHILQDRPGFKACGNEFGSNSDKLYFIHSKSNPPNSGTKTLELAVLSGNIENGGDFGYIYNLNLDKYYYKPYNAGQPGTETDLFIDNSVFRSAFTDNNVIYAVQTSWENDKAVLYYSVIQLNTSDLEFSRMNSIVIADTNLHLAFSSISPTGIKDGQGINAVAIATCFASEQRYAGVGVFYVSPDGQVSDMSVCKEGENNLAWYSNTHARWGDYTDIVRRYNVQGELWVAGGYARADTRSGSWLSKINVNSSVSGIQEKKNKPSKTYPNPAQNIISTDFPVVKADVYTAKLIGLNGKEIHLKTAFLKQGLATLGADVTDISSGVYFLSISNSVGIEQVNKKIIISH